MNIGEKVKKFYVYTGISDSGYYTFLSIDSLDLNDGKSISDVEHKKHYFKKHLFNHKTIGGIYEVYEIDENVSYKKDQYPIQNWKNQNDKIIWFANKRVNEMIISVNKEGKENKFNEHIEPIKSFYRTLSYQKKALLIAEIIRIITS